MYTFNSYVIKQCSTPNNIYHSKSNSTSPIINLILCYLSLEHPLEIKIKYILLGVIIAFIIDNRKSS